MKTIAILLSFVMISVSCKSSRSPSSGGGSGSSRYTVTSANEPKNDSDALKIVKIRMVPPPVVVHRAYEAGLDDNMKLVIRLRSDRLDDFWGKGPWLRDKAVRSSGDGSLGRAPRLSKHGSVEWLKWQTSSMGWSAVADLPSGEVANLYIAEDIEEGFLLIYIFWHQT